MVTASVQAMKAVEAVACRVGDGLPKGSDNNAMAGVIAEALV
jgi:hypothetical protein